ncbi:MAG TPA: LysE family translocator [Alphaproteobacteria bacterium]|jgi:threonine/homoserine/homoserine lactone efflux protein|nr:LysE family translocator [Chloroflexota bacterium]HIA22381.1 LysE family translocator [Alphaproteobacteria bacterium]HIM21199.1 LysE family translocator [Rhodospirillales bacterium]HIB19766.1 LysE family translocator [Alphaproteobacteria bacterium]HIB57110.1 LysE family translocator [Alphaproteobacteria bacterium]|tara:strand:+ start:289 stop:918 length:630 start_codon:yes stop_codon:yes gene_type:complete
MPIEAWLALAGAFILGAMSPGPSLATVLRNSVVAGRRNGVLTGLGHGFGFGIYSFLAASGMITAISIHTATVDFLRLAGAIALIVLGYVFAKQSLSGSIKRTDTYTDKNQFSAHSSFGQGFLIALLNPKIFAWMLAIYAPFINADLSMHILLAMALMGVCIDATWYVGVAIFMTAGDRAAKLGKASNKFSAAMALLMFIFAAIIFAEML